MRTPATEPDATGSARVDVSGRRLAWQRRRRSLGDVWRVFRHSPMGVTGLVTLLVFVVIAVAAPLLADPSSIDPTETITTNPLNAAPSSEFWLGTDDVGRPVVSLLIWGARISLLVGLTATVGTMLIGSIVGLAGGFAGGRLDGVLNALTNWFLVIPWIALAAVMATILGASVANIILVIAVTSWAGTARLVRAQTLTVRERPYVERARALGAGSWHLVTRHVFPNVFPVIFANTILTVALAILSETTLSLLGLGDPRSVSWGQTIGEAFDAGALTAGQWWWLLPPGVCVMLVCLAFTMCGYALDEIVNPKLRRR
ncbi:MAG: ABC transporter permease [Actinomycetota bacterium]